MEWECLGGYLVEFGNLVSVVQSLVWVVVVVVFAVVVVGVVVAPVVGLVVSALCLFHSLILRLTHRLFQRLSLVYCHSNLEKGFYQGPAQERLKLLDPDGLVTTILASVFHLLVSLLTGMKPG